jgi:F-type H+-transporting ATPase subunit alpha
MEGSRGSRPETGMSAVTAKSLTEELKKALPKEALKPVVTEIGEIVYVGDGICKISGLPSAHVEDVVEIQTEEAWIPALILGITLVQIEAVVLGEFTHIKQGQVVRSTGRNMQITAGPGTMGRVMNPLGLPMDGKGPIKGETLMPVEFAAPGVAQRQPVTQQMESGVLVVDAIIPLGRGQRELVIGDRKSGKTRLVASLICNQKGKNIPCVYVAIGAQKAKVRALQELLEKNGAMEYTTIVMGGSDDPPSLNYIAPYAGTAVAEYYMYRGQDAIVIYDDLSKHAKAYRQMSLLLKRSPGRDAYPGDIFYLHSRLLERSARLHPSLGGGSLTGFPMAETQNGDVSEYICTNLMSITDGHIYLDVNLMHLGTLPAVDSGTSVSRIGGSVQPPILRKMGELAGTVMARYNEVKSFETINTEISEDTEREIKRGKRMLEMFSQDATDSLLNDEKILLINTVVTGLTDPIELLELRAVKKELVSFYRANDYAEWKERSVKEKSIDAVKELFDKIIAEYAEQSTLPAAKLLVKAPKKEEKPLPIIPDPNQPKRDKGQDVAGAIEKKASEINPSIFSKLTRKK